MQLLRVYHNIVVYAIVVLTTILWYTSNMKKDSLEPEQLAAWRTFITAHAVVINLIEQDLAGAQQLPLSSYDVLLALVSAPNRRLRMHELAQAVVLSRSG